MTNIDKDLASIQKARDLCTRAREAMRSFQFASQEEVDRICEAMVEAAMSEAPGSGRWLTTRPASAIRCTRS